MPPAEPNWQLASVESKGQGSGLVIKERDQESAEDKFAPQSGLVSVLCTREGHPTVPSLLRQILYIPSCLELHSCEDMFLDVCYKQVIVYNLGSNWKVISGHLTFEVYICILVRWGPGVGYRAVKNR